MADADWKVLPHGPIDKLSENVWRVLGTLPRMSLRRNMVVARLQDGRLVIHSAVALDAPSLAELEAWGEPAFLIVPNGWHRLDAAAFKRRYPKLRVLTPPGARDKVARLVAVDGSDADFGDPRVSYRVIDGLGGLEGVLSVRSADGVTLALTDCVFNMATPSRLLDRAFTTVMGSAPGPRISRLFKAAGVKDSGAFKAELLRLAATPQLVRVVVAHDRVAHGIEAAETLRQAAAYL